MLRYVVLLGLSLLTGCAKESKPLPPAKNLPPTIQTMIVRPSRVHASEEVAVFCQAIDPDRQVLKYWWSATGGSFPEGTVFSSVVWRSPPSFAPQIITAWVTDFTDTASAALPITITRVASPGPIEFVNGASLIDVSWQASPDEGMEDWRGYEVFAASRSLVDLPVDSLLHYRLTQIPLERLQYRFSPAVPGQKIYFHVRARRDYEGRVERSEIGDEINTAARLDGFGVASLFEVQSRRGAKGVHLPGGLVEPMDPAHGERIQLYLGTEDAHDGRGELRLKSPSLRAYQDPSWAGQVTGIHYLREEWGQSTPPDTAYVWEAPVEAGKVFGLLTADGHHAKFRVLEMRGSSPERRIEFQWAWQPLAGYPRY